MDIIQHFISEDIIYALGWTVVHSIWQGFLVALLMMVVMMNIKERSARIRYEVAGISLFLVLVLSICTFLIMYGASGRHTLEVLTFSSLGIIPSISTGSFFQETVQTGIDYFNQYIPLIVTIWFAGAVFFSIRLLGGLAYVQHIKYNHNTPLSDYWQMNLRRIAQQLHFNRPMALLESSLIHVPMVIGFFKPVILMPLGAVNALTEKEVEAILSHELAHIVRNDFVLNIFLSFIEVLFYYHPAVWWIAANVRTERENCCDDLAIQLCGNSLTYAKALVSLQEINQSQGSIPAFAMSLSGRKNQMINRVKRILNQPQNKSNIMEKLTATSLLLLVITFLSFSANTPFAKPGKVLNFHHHFDVQPDTPSDVVFHVKPTFHVTSSPMLVEPDTIPTKKKDRQRLVHTENGKTVEVNLEDGEIVNLIIDGEQIPKEELADYNDLVDEIIASMPEPPPPPPAPPAPPAIERPVPPAPPAAPKWFQKKQHKKTITTEKGNDGYTTIIIGEEGQEPVKIKVQSKEDVIIVDGNEIKSGDKAIIITEDETPFIWNEEANHYIAKVFPDDVDFHFEESTEDAIAKLREHHEHWAENNNEWMEGWNAQQHELLEHHEHSIQKLHEQLEKEDWPGLQEDLNKAQKQYRELLEHHNLKEKEIQDHLQGLQYLDKARAYQNLAPKVYYFNHDNSLKAKIERELIEDGLIQDKSNYRFSLSGKGLKINGKKQPEAVWEKYKHIYEKENGTKLTRKSTIEINVN